MQNEFVRKAKRINRIDNSLSNEELFRLLPEINLINDETIRQHTIQTFLYGCPDYFWTRPTSSTGNHHSPDESGEFGNLIHTKRVFVEYDNIVESYVEADVLTEWQADCGRAAALVHDMLKYGWPSEQNSHTTTDHDCIAGAVARHIGGLPDECARLIEAHNGPWYDGPTSDTQHEWLFHSADKSASGVPEDIRAVYYLPDEVRKMWPEVPVIHE